MSAAMAEDEVLGQGMAGFYCVLKRLIDKPKPTYLVNGSCSPDTGSRQTAPTSCGYATLFHSTYRSIPVKFDANMTLNSSCAPSCPG